MDQHLYLSIGSNNLSIPKKENMTETQKEEKRENKLDRKRNWKMSLFLYFSLNDV